jgi:hypothetical protein
VVGRLREQPFASFGGDENLGVWRALVCAAL